MMKIKKPIIENENKKPNLRRLFGAHKFQKPVKQLMKEMDKELYND